MKGGQNAHYRLTKLLICCGDPLLIMDIVHRLQISKCSSFLILVHTTMLHLLALDWFVKYIIYLSRKQNRILIIRSECGDQQTSLLLSEKSMDI